VLLPWSMCAMMEKLRMWSIEIKKATGGWPSLSARRR
jgi:hypothetical protein